MPTDIIINPIDLKQNTAIGIGLPMINFQGLYFNQTYTTLDQAEANARNLLLTNQGERLMQPTFGCDLYRSLFDNMTLDFIESIKAKIRSQFTYWLPYIFINQLDVITNETDSTSVNKLFIRQVISLKHNTFDTRSIDLTISQNKA